MRESNPALIVTSGRANPLLSAVDFVHEPHDTPKPRIIDQSVSLVL
jgi:hypothetical protein